MLLSVGSRANGIHARAVFADSVNSSAVEFDNALVASADVEDVGESAVLLFEGDDLVAMDRLAGAGWPDDEHDPNAVHIHVLKERRPCAGLEDVEVFGVEIF